MNTKLFTAALSSKNISSVDVAELLVNKFTRTEAERLAEILLGVYEEPKFLIARMDKKNIGDDRVLVRKIFLSFNKWSNKVTYKYFRVEKRYFSTEKEAAEWSRGEDDGDWRVCYSKSDDNPYLGIRCDWETDTDYYEDWIAKLSNS